MELLDISLLVVLIAVVILRGLWIFDYCHRFWRKPGDLSRLRSLVWAIRAPTSAVFVRDADPATAKAVHQRALDAAVHQVEILLLVGSVAFASWTQLFSASDHVPGGEVSAFSRNLLLAAAIVLIVGPGIFRSSGGHMTYMGRESMSAIGYTTLTVALASILADIAGSAGAAVGLAFSLAVFWRETLECRAALDANRHVRTRPPPSANI